MMEKSLKNSSVNKWNFNREKEALKEEVPQTHNNDLALRDHQDQAVPRVL
jgi:hypothetical protein